MNALRSHYYRVGYEPKQQQQLLQHQQQEEQFLEPFEQKLKVLTVDTTLSRAKRYHQQKRNSHHNHNKKSATNSTATRRKMNGSIIEATDDLPHVRIFLSRSAYALGGSVVGTIIIRHGRGTAYENDRPSLRSMLSSVVIYVAGLCRIDPRWHNISEYAKIYGQVHPFLQLLYQDFEPELLSSLGGDETVCFWATNGLELLELEERELGKLEEYENQEILAYTFRADIPIDLPHSINATTCRYSYSVDVLIRTKTKQQLLKKPFQVWTNAHEAIKVPRSIQQDKGNVIISSRVKFGTCHGIAHSVGLPIHLSATEIHRPKGQMSIAMPRQTREDIQTLRICNATGRPACVMTIVGYALLTPGARIHLQWDFPDSSKVVTSSSPSSGDNNDNNVVDDDTNNRWIPCHQVSACLLGEECAVYEDGKKSKTQSYVFDTCHEWVDPGVTNRISKSLLLPLDAPCNVYTDVMELTIKCQIDITILDDGEKYNNLTIELPCHVVNSYKNPGEIVFDEEENQVLSLSDLLRNSNDNADGSNNNKQESKQSSSTSTTATFPTDGIIEDLKILALKMEDNLRRYNVP